MGTLILKPVLSFPSADSKWSTFSDLTQNCTKTLTAAALSSEYFNRQPSAAHWSATRLLSVMMKLSNKMSFDIDHSSKPTAAYKKTANRLWWRNITRAKMLLFASTSEVAVQFHKLSVERVDRSMSETSRQTSKGRKIGTWCICYARKARPAGLSPHLGCVFVQRHRKRRMARPEGPSQCFGYCSFVEERLSLIHISEPTRPY